MSAAHAPHRLWVVRVRDGVNGEIAGHGGCRYESPPQPRAQALALVGALLRGPAQPASADGSGEWALPVAGGRRVIVLEPAAFTGDRPARRGQAAGRGAV